MHDAPVYAWFALPALLCLAAALVVSAVPYFVDRTYGRSAPGRVSNQSLRAERAELP